MVSLRNYKKKNPNLELPAELQARIDSWNARKGKNYSYDEKTDFGQECLLLSTDVAQWINENCVHKAVEKEDLKLQDVSLIGDNDLNKTLQPSEKKGNKPKEAINVEITGGRDKAPPVIVESPQVLSTVNDKEESTQKQETKEQEQTNEQKAVKTNQLTDKSINTPSKKPQKTISTKVNQNSLKTQSKQPQKLNDIEQILKNLYDIGFRELKKSELKKYKIPIKYGRSYEGEFYSLEFCVLSWFYPYDLIKK